MKDTISVGKLIRKNPKSDKWWFTLCWETKVVYPDGGQFSERYCYDSPGFVKYSDCLDMSKKYKKNVEEKWDEQKLRKKSFFNPKK